MKSMWLGNFPNLATIWSSILIFSVDASEDSFDGNDEALELFEAETFEYNVV